MLTAAENNFKRFREFDFSEFKKLKFICVLFYLPLEYDLL
jgi:hypothetical protein